MKQTLRQNTPLRYAINAVVVATVFFGLTAAVQNGWINRYYAILMVPCCYNIIMAASLNLTAGFLGQLPLGHAGFMSVGAYASALFTMGVDWSPAAEMAVGLVIGGLVAGLFGILIGIPALRLRGDYLAIITLGFGEIIRVVILNLDFTGGAFGLSGIEKHSDLTIGLICVILTLFLLTTLMRSRHGRAILSIREDEIAAAACGINTTYYKTMAFAISAFFAGVAGGLYAHHLTILDPSTFGFSYSIEFLVMVVLGGMGSMLGSVVAAIVLTLLPELLRELADYRMIVYSLLLVIVMIFKPSGLFGRYDFSLCDFPVQLKNGVKRLFTRKKKGAEQE